MPDRRSARCVNPLAVGLETTDTFGWMASTMCCTERRYPATRMLRTGPEFAGFPKCIDQTPANGLKHLPPELGLELRTLRLMHECVKPAALLKHLAPKCTMSVRPEDIGKHTRAFIHTGSKTFLVSSESNIFRGCLLVAPTLFSYSYTWGPKRTVSNSGSLG